MKGDLRLAPLVKRWQERLRLRDWTISATWVNEHELKTFFEDDDETDPEKMAEQACAATDAGNAWQWDTTPLETRTIQIRLKRGDFESATEVERTIAHELMHVLFWPIAPKDDDELRRILLEQIIATLEPLLVPSKP